MKKYQKNMKRITIIFLLTGIIIASCKSGTKKTANEVLQVKHFEITEAWRTDTLLLTPESVIFDNKRDIFYVSNLNNEPRLKDGNGFISRVDKNGKIVDLRWIEGLSSPKGLAISGDTLFAADIDEVVAMDINSGRIIKKISVQGAALLNDITTNPDGILYISDTDANRIYVYDKGVISVWFDEQLNGLNGLLWDNDRLLVASQGSNDFAAIDLKSKNRQLITDGINHGDGIAWTGIPGYYIVTDWEGEIFMINPDSTAVSLLRTKDQGINSADIEYLRDMNLLLVPTFYRNSLVAYNLAEKKDNQ